MDAFYASVEQRDDPGLRGRPVIVGAPPNQRGVVCAASYEARKFGVRSAMPSATAGRLCPTGIFVRPHMDHYREESRHIMRIVAETGAVVEPMSIDEAYLDVSSVSQAEDIDASLLKAMPLALHVKQRILSERKLTATIGIASNKLLAKTASDHKKPDELTVISDREKVSFLRPLQVRVLYGVGKVTEQVLNQAGTLNLHIRAGQMSLALVTQTFIHQLRQRMGETFAQWDSPHLAKHLFSGLEGDLRVHHDTVLVTYYNAPNADRWKEHFENLPQRLQKEGVNPRVPWLYNFKLDFRFK